jgi:hypothetical protein
MDVIGTNHIHAEPEKDRIFILATAMASKATATRPQVTTQFDTATLPIFHE